VSSAGGCLVRRSAHTITEDQGMNYGTSQKVCL
jgi:hypothetical protein